MEVHRAAVVGCGAFARGWHLPNISANPRIELIATCDTDAKAARECCREFKARRALVDWHELVEASDIDLIILATHTGLRSQLIIPALNSGKAVYVEKPLADSVPEMLAIAHAVRTTGTPVCVGHNRRSSPAIMDLKRLLEKAMTLSDAGPLSMDRRNERTCPVLPEERRLQILMRVNDDSRSWKDWIFSDDKGILFAEMVHFIDVALWLNHTRPVRVYADGSARGNFSLIIRFEDGSITTIHHTLSGHFDYPKELFEVSVHHVTLAVEHHVELRQRGLPDEPFRRTYPFGPACPGDRNDGIEGFHRAVSKTFAEARTTNTPPVFISPDKGHVAQLDRFLDCIEGRGENPCDVTSAVRVTVVALKLLESIRNEKPVTISEEDWHIPTG